MADYSGKKCKGCNTNIWSSDEVMICSHCGEPYHKKCWETANKCQVCGGEAGQEVISAKTNENNPLSIAFANSDSLLFSNIAAKLKTVAKVFSLLGIIGGVIICIILIAIDEDMILLGLFVGAVTAIISWISSFTLYGFGELIATSQRTAGILSEILKNSQK